MFSSINKSAILFSKLNFVLKVVDSQELFFYFLSDIFCCLECISRNLYVELAPNTWGLVPGTLGSYVNDSYFKVNTTPYTQV